MTSRDSTQSIDWGIAARLKNDPDFRQRFVKTWAQAEVATQVRTLRQKRRLNQKQLAKRAGTGQSAISRVEQADYDGWTFKTLVRLADGLDARLRIRFEPMEDVVSVHESGERANLEVGNPVVGHITTKVAIMSSINPVAGGFKLSSTGRGNEVIQGVTRFPKVRTDTASGGYF